jgi:hypothetical protein
MRSGRWIVAAVLALLFAALAVWIASDRTHLVPGQETTAAGAAGPAVPVPTARGVRVADRSDVPAAGVGPDRGGAESAGPMSVGASVEVHVVDERGAGVAGLRVSAEFRRFESAEADTDANGVATLRIDADAAEIGVVPGVALRFRGAESRPWTSGTRSVTLVVHDCIRVEGEVQEPDGEIVPNAIVRFEFDDGARQSAKADRKGRFREILPAGASGRIEFDGLDDE